MYSSQRTLQRSLRKMSKYPRQPRVFSQARILAPIFGFMTVLALWGLVSTAKDYITGLDTTLDSVLLMSGISLVCILLLAYPFMRTFGVDEQKVWTKFGPFFYREIRFDQVTRFTPGLRRYILWAGKTRMNIEYDRFDYVLAFIRLIEETHNHRFCLQKIEPTDPDWEAEAATWRSTWLDDILADHAAYYQQHPDEYQQLVELIGGPLSKTATQILQATKK